MVGGYLICSGTVLADLKLVGDGLGRKDAARRSDPFATSGRRSGSLRLRSGQSAETALVAQTLIWPIC